MTISRRCRRVRIVLGNRIKIAVILRRSDARWAKVAGIAQPKNPVSTRRTSRQSTCLIRRPASHGIAPPPPAAVSLRSALHCASAHRLRPRRRSVQDDLIFFGASALRPKII